MTPTRNPSVAHHHQAVMLDQVLNYLRPAHIDGLYLDATFGRGGHSRAILSAMSPKSRLWAADRDPEAIAWGTGQSDFRDDRRLSILHLDYRNLPDRLGEEGCSKVAGCIVDLGVSSPQLEVASRGFSFRLDGPLDMRFDQSSAMDLDRYLRETDEATLADAIWRYGDERKARRIARRLKRAVVVDGIRTTGELALQVAAAVGSRSRRIHPATRTFQALRIAVNQELQGLGEFVTQIARLLVDAGRIVVIAYHSVEDRIVKRTLKKLSGNCICVPNLPACVCGCESIGINLTKRPIRPDQQEVERNIRSDSAKMRVFEKRLEI